MENPEPNLIRMQSEAANTITVTDQNTMLTATEIQVIEDAYGVQLQRYIQLEVFNL